MHRHRSLFRSTALASVAALGLTAAPVPGLAQPAPPPDAAALTSADPPARVGRLAALSGTVSTHGAQDTSWSAGFVNEPVAAGTGLWTPPDAQATLELGSGRLAMAGGTGLDLTGLDDAGLRATLSQGEVYLRVARLGPNETWQIETPRGQVTLQAPGRYVVVAGTTDSPTLVTALEGTAAVSAPGVDLGVRARETAEIDGTDPFQATVGPAQQDAFATAMLARERPPSPPAVPPPPVVAAMPGGADLSGYGTWAAAPEYGTVWYPQVVAGWVPYRDGRWAYMAPWGWTWVDAAPWGFAPFHYGRWVQIDSRWAWVPAAVASAPTATPVYAPALVSFFAVGTGAAVGAGLGAALATGAIGWYPLAPHEEYRPWYPASPRYVHAVNVSTRVTNVTNITNVTVINRGAATVVPANAMLDSRPVRGLVRPITPQALAAARPIVGQQPLRPTLATVGVTPSVARRMDLRPVPGAPVPRAIPGPMIRPVAMGTSARPPLLGAAAHPVPTSGASPQPHHPATDTMVAGHPEAASPHDARMGQPAPLGAPRHGPAETLSGAAPAHPPPLPQTHAAAPHPTAQVHASPPFPAPHETLHGAVHETPAPRAPEPRVEAPHLQAPHVEAPQVQAPHVEAPHVQAPHAPAPHPRPEHAVGAPQHGTPAHEPSPPSEKRPS
ncbi:MAG: hypothetical protein BGO51_14195 [Rhodospirillales bacterium 69-11]|nr:hypothetical protein [Rhodospirillales bacterium]OJW26550.1 MAG: hypothetical protein BGO51_14195 [Rhodospirillales bacterium 69-11]